MQRPLIGTLALSLLFALAGGGCGANGTGGAGDTGGTAVPGSIGDAGLPSAADAALSGCMVSMTGAVTTSFPCERAYVVWSNGTKTSTFISDGVEPNYAHDFNVSIELPARPELKTYTSTDPDADRYNYLRVMDGLYRWEAHGGPAGPGSYSMTLTDLGPQTGSEYDIRWQQVHGSVQAALVAVGGNGETGTIAFTLTF